MRAKTTCRSSIARSARLSRVCALVALTLSACTESRPQIEIPDIVSRPDGGGVPIPDGAVLCDDDRECDDGIACTRDVCAPGGFCVSAEDSSLCSDGIFCNGAEVCDALVGCRAGLPRTCSDDDVCTVDYCDEAGKRCAHDPRDFDEDGEVDWHCFGGTDCDDFDVTRSSAAAEICDDDVDNDCDDMIDEATCGRAEHDTCEDALDVSEGGLFVLELGGTAPQYGLGCGMGAGQRDVVATFELTEPRDVQIVVRGLLVDGTQETATVAVRTDCDDVVTELECRHGFPGVLRRRALPAGRYFAIVRAGQSARVTLDVQLSEPTEAPTNQSCDDPIDVSEGGRFESDFVDVSDEHELPCAFTGTEDLVYSFRLTRTQDVEISAISFTGQPMSFAVRSQCDAPESTLRCLLDDPARGRLHELPAGTYYIIVESSPSREVDFSLDVAVLPPTPPPPGDSCGSPLELDYAPDGTATAVGTLADRQDLVNVVCGCSEEQGMTAGCGFFLSDAVYRVEVDEPTDLRLRIAGAEDAQMAYDLRAICDQPGTQIACGNPSRIDARVRNVLPGEYFLIVESANARAFSLEVERLPRTEPRLVGTNDACANAAVVPPGGDVFLGDTSLEVDTYQTSGCGGGAKSKDAVYRVDLPQRARVIASTEAGFDTVLYRYDGTVDDVAACVSGNDAACNDDDGLGGTNSLLDETLEAGRYFYVVDGFGEGADGRYVIEFLIGEPDEP